MKFELSLAAVAILAISGEDLRAQVRPLGTGGGPAPQSQPAITAFDAPGGGTLTQGLPVAINAGGTLVTTYSDAAYVSHGLIREPNGVLNTFDIKGSSGTIISAINDAGAITGYFLDSAFVAHGYVASPNLFTCNYENARIFTFDVPAASSLAIIPGTAPAGINNFGAVTGTYQDANSVFHSFVLLKDFFSNWYSAKNIVTFEAPGASVDSLFDGTSATSINDLGTITGYYTFGTQDDAIFARTIDGKFNTFNAPGSVAGAIFVAAGYPSSLNDVSQVTGNYCEATSKYLPSYDCVVRGFIKGPLGGYQGFDAAVSTPFPTFTYPQAINLAGEVTGYDWDQDNVYHGFVRTPGGSVTLFDAPLAGAGPLQGTLPLAINLNGTVAGYYLDTASVLHAFVRTPASGR